MGKIFIAVVFIGLLLFYFYTYTPKIAEQKTVVLDRETTSPSPTPKNSIQLVFDNRHYTLVYEPITGKKIRLIPNFAEKKSAAAIAEENSCLIASSGGFYTKEDKPLGLFKFNNKIVGQKINNSSLVTGFLYVDDSGGIYINDEVVDDYPTILQSGPLFTNSKLYPTKSDEYARRTVVIEDDNRKEYLATIFGTENTYDGPRLSDLPTIIFSIKNPFQVQRVLNLDGGSASFFKATNGFTVSEIVAVGSIICIN